MLMVGIAANFLALKTAMRIPLAHVLWGQIALFWLPIMLVLAGLIALVRGHRPRTNPITALGAIIVGIAVFLQVLTYDNRMNMFNLIVGGAAHVSMYLTGLVPVLVAIAVRRRFQRNQASPT